MDNLHMGNFFGTPCIFDCEEIETSAASITCCFARFLWQNWREWAEAV